VATDVAMIAVRLGGAGWSWSFTLHGPVELADVSAHRLAEKVRSAALVVCISDFARSQLMSLVPRREWAKLRLVRCGIDVDQFSRNGHPVAAHDGMHVITVGRLSARKAHSVLVEAIAALRSEGVDVRLTIVGDGEERAGLEALAGELEVSDRIAFAGAVAHDALTELLAAADVFCLPSASEGLPVVLMEAMAVGLPVVAARIMGIPELVEDGMSGYTVAPGRADSLADALRRLAGERERWEQMGAAGRRKVEADHDVRRSAQELQELLESAAAEPVGSAR
jgi:colanic acid/amylovoran biosynthesis glycosyltransferase